MFFSVEYVMFVPPTLGLTFGCGICRAVNIVRCSDDVHSRHGLGAFVSGSLVKVSTQYFARATANFSPINERPESPPILPW